ncbi:universal stress protein [Paraburkholderia sp. DHOC27]|uniref:universal stress protein n=1 Tax=Paraburkholderia sp. DHOC27 TaxID=2303330 RepID=UPI000E3EA097|nr:universal stress protein [Paraburkholderia sp. DHOC27]RFU45162.1 universal stress protein [Paraburkholderia sp. DHOC27]
MYKHILVAVGSNPDFTTLQSAIDMARDCGARLTALHVVDAAPHITLMADLEVGAAIDAFETQGRAIVEQCSRALRQAGCDGEAQMWATPLCGACIGHAVAAAARELDADLIMVSSVNPGWLRIYAQNVPKDIMRFSTLPVLVMTRPFEVPQQSTFAHAAA